MNTDVRIPIFSWWLLVPTVLALLTSFSAAKWRKRWCPITAIISLAAMLFMIVMWPLSWKTAGGMAATWHEIAGKGERLWDLAIGMNMGGVRLHVRAVDISYHSEDFGTPPVLTIGYGPNGGFYPLFWDSLSITKSDFIQKKLGFQICWFHGKDPAGSPVSTLYSITIPNWFVLLLCIPFPMICARRFLRLRYRVRNGLCLKCGFDLRESNSRCPECGMKLEGHPSSEEA